MIEDETDPMIAGFKDCRFVSMESSSPQSTENSLYDNSTENIHNDETFLLNSIDNADLLHFSESTVGLVTLSPSELSQNLQTIISLNTLEGNMTSSQNNELNIEIPERKIFPNLDEHDSAGLKFDLLLDPKHDGSKNNWYYSTKLNKVFLRLDKPFYIDMQYLPKFQEPLYLRIMIVYIDDMGSPVLRCNNHLCKDKTENEKEKYSVVRCGNNDVKYIGTPEGKNCEDRLALLIKLNNVQPNENYICKQSIQLTFVCQNSCIGRKQTALIFTLENRTQILGKKVVNVKVCSCPKRDKQKDEQNFLSKRKAEAEYSPCGKRPCKVIKIKEEPITDAPQTPANSSVPSNTISPLSPSPDIKFSENGSVTFEQISVPNVRIAQKVAQYIFDAIAGEMANDKDNSEKYAKHLRTFKKLSDKL